MPNFDLAAPAGGWKRDARVRIQADRSLGDVEWTATFNGEAVSTSADVSEQFAVPYPSIVAKPDELRAWILTARLLREGKNSLEVTMNAGSPSSVLFVDLATS